MISHHESGIESGIVVIKLEFFAFRIYVELPAHPFEKSLNSEFRIAAA